MAIEATGRRALDETWYDESDDAEEEEYPIGQYDITASPNDFNVLTIFSFIESGAVRIPGFQRNYVWDIKHASKLIESLIIGLPVPQIFLYEEARNRFLVIDGQQRLMSIYYFMKTALSSDPETDGTSTSRGCAGDSSRVHFGE